MKVRYSYRLRVSAANERLLLREWGLCRFVWNECVAESRAMPAAREAARLAGATELPMMSASRAEGMVTALRRSREWLAAGSSVPQRQTTRDFMLAHRSAFSVKGRGRPRFRKRDRSLPSMNYTTNGFSLKDHQGQARLYLAGGIVVRPVWSRELPAAPSSVRVTQDSLGRWWASFVVEVQPGTPAGTMPDEGRVIGVDWGVSQPATTAILDLDTGELDTGVVFDFVPRGYDRRNQGEVGRRQRQMARRAKRDARGRLVGDQSAGYRKAKHLAAKARAKAKAQRRDDSRKWAAKVAREHDVVAVEDFRPAFLAKSTMARKAADNAVAQLKADLLWAAAKAGRKTVLVNPAFTTMDCSTCGARAKHRLPLDQRTYHCTACGLVLDRDKNAAINVIARAGLTPVGVEGIRRGPASAAHAA